MAFSTSSSSATLPVSMRCGAEDLKIPREICSFVLPLGATINMNGTALYLGVASVFVAQVFSVPLDWQQQLVIVLLATLSAIGTPGIPSASIVFLVIILGRIGVPDLGIALIWVMDRILDMCRTTLNVMGDLTAALYIQASESKRNSDTGV
jgi:Na+/H+-dicarboxylate symporter